MLWNYLKIMSSFRSYQCGFYEDKESKSGREFAQVALLLHFNQQGRMKGPSQGEWGVLCLSQTHGYPDVLEELGRNSEGHYKLPLAISKVQVWPWRVAEWGGSNKQRPETEGVRPVGRKPACFIIGGTELGVNTLSIVAESPCIHHLQTLGRPLLFLDIVSCL